MKRNAGGYVKCVMEDEVEKGSHTRDHEVGARRQRDKEGSSGMAGVWQQGYPEGERINSAKGEIIKRNRERSEGGSDEGKAKKIMEFEDSQGRPQLLALKRRYRVQDPRIHNK